VSPGRRVNLEKASAQGDAESAPALSEWIRSSWPAGWRGYWSPGSVVSDGTSVEVDPGAGAAPVLAPGEVLSLTESVPIPR
jgi:hypothetical protein